jgi:hypothetical protein
MTGVVVFAIGCAIGLFALGAWTYDRFRRRDSRRW